MKCTLCNSKMLPILNWGSNNSWQSCQDKKCIGNIIWESNNSWSVIPRYFADGTDYLFYFKKNDHFFRLKTRVYAETAIYVFKNLKRIDRI